MGVAGYFSYIIKNHKKIIRKLSETHVNIDNFYLDCNSIIYDVINKMAIKSTLPDNHNIIIVKVIETIKEYISIIKPSNTLIIAFDGTAPVAKLEQQRSRRFKSAYEKSVSMSIFNTTENDSWNTSQITPGTAFMKQLDTQINQAFLIPHSFNLSKIVFSGSNECGEGEHKIFKYIRETPAEHSDKNTIIYGLDADLIMLSINHLPITPNIYLFRETPEFIKSINNELEPNENYMLDIPELAKTITVSMNNGIQENSSNRIYDYIFLCFLLGNDFMPHFPAINIRTGGIDKMLNAYKSVIRANEFLTDGKTIYWKNVRKVIQFLADNETEFIRKEHKIRERKEKMKLPDITPKEKMECFINSPSYERCVEKHINPFSPNWQYRYYKVLFDIEINDQRRNQICSNYLEGLEWTMKYYTTGCPDWRWKYNYNYPPLLTDLIKYIPFFNTSFISNNHSKPVSETLQLCYVLPKQSLHLLPPNVYQNITKYKSHLYVTSCQFSWSYCKYFWESHPNLPHVDINELELFVNNDEINKMK